MKMIGGVPLDQAILSAAIATFVAHGYENTSMDEVAARASTTKRTVYAHFGNKEALFRSALAKAVERFQDEMPKLADLSRPAAELEAFAVGFSDLSTWRGAVRLQRVVMSGAEQFAGLGTMLHREVIERAEAAVADFLRALDAHHGTDPGPRSYELLASMFINLTTGRQRFATLLQAREPLSEHPLHLPAPDHDRAAIRDAVEIFLRGALFAGSRETATGTPPGDRPARPA
ncbi:TetR/AcrR family transcriptional regulator [Catenuloplanes indicus]|uniref:AcrR family transcriptional regulator n=1 Tax=Catenuloplanes indicus TaxID=137267 RepID=A0AAE3W7L4_9ACTN|nr:TetR/AcrR family transcriptional regulator [Catenuloplanes indicus]MDQ0371106.1 AcrR family transcriptional regulator [Catenuloplanes indicus]